MNKQIIINKIKTGIKNNEEISPFLFVGKDITKVSYEVKEIIKDLEIELGITSHNLYHIEGADNVIIKKEVDNLINKSYIKSENPNIFLIERISKMNNKSGNNMLKFLEEPGVGNIVFLTNNGESKVLETILSRVNIVTINSNIIDNYRDDFIELINAYVLYDSHEILNYFYKNKLEKEEYIMFFQSLIHFIKTHKILENLLDEIFDSINGIKSNNFIARNQVDKILLMIKN